MNKNWPFLILAMVCCTGPAVGCAVSPPAAALAWPNPNPYPRAPTAVLSASVLEPGRIFLRPATDLALALPPSPPKLDPAAWVPLADVRLVLHVSNLRLEEMLAQALGQTAPYTGPWRVEWRLKATNEDLRDELISLSAETTFGDFINHVADFIRNERGVNLAFNLFNAERLLVVTDAPRS